MLNSFISDSYSVGTLFQVLEFLVRGLITDSVHDEVLSFRNCRLCTWSSLEESEETDVYYLLRLLLRVF